MESKTKALIITLLFSLIIATVNKNDTGGTVIELVILIYFIGLVIYAELRGLVDKIYPIMSVIFLFLVAAFSFFKEELLAEQFSVFLFYSLVSILLCTFLGYLKHEK